ncbi:hypothetical protein [Candidatus Electrothrix sp.]|uniref:hypothetical protein n=1 Tax=Candidatus Electrothrix sp. TaxID=2170559 RepID=UPI0040577BEB
MKPAAFLELAEQVGVSLCIGSAGTIKAKGESALLQAALGSTYDETAVTEENGEEVRRVTKNKVIPANVAAAKYWLNNRNPERWQDSPEPSDNDRAGVEMFAEMIREMRQEKDREISDKCMKDIEDAPNPQAAFVRAAIDIQPG